MTQKIKIADTFYDHAMSRYFERTDTDISMKEIAKSVANNNLIYVKRLTPPSRSLVYATVRPTPRDDEEVFKLVFNRKSKTIITILPWKSVFYVCYVIEMEKYSKSFTIHLYPDCYLETEKPNALTRIYEHVEGDAPIQLEYNHPLFEIVFNAAWITFERYSNAHKTFQIEREKGNETFKVVKTEDCIQFHYRSDN
jgi:hypothetical protein